MASTVPATPAMPTVMVANRPARLMPARYGRTSRGASTMPTKMLAAAEVPTGPVTPIVRRSTQPTACTTLCRMPQ